MAAVTITLSEAELIRVRRRAAREGFADVEEYLREVLADRLQVSDEDDEEYHPAPMITHAQLEAMAIEGLESPGRERTKADFDKVREEIIARHQQSRG